MPKLRQVTPPIARSDTGFCTRWHSSTGPAPPDSLGGPARVTVQSSFVPRELLERPEDFRAEADVTWRYASNLDEAIRLA